MDSLPTAFVAGLLLTRDWERLAIVFKGLEDTEQRIQVLFEALESVGSYRAAEILHNAINTIEHLTSEEE